LVSSVEETLELVYPVEKREHNVGEEFGEG
jgi:hypothetical protein